MSENSIEIGDRVRVEDDYGTIRYIGPIDGFEGQWLGVEWDNITRGKHSGCYNNVRYFHTSVENSGSFIKLSKADLGTSFPKALKMKYGDESNSTLTPDYINLPQKCGPERHIEMVGMKKILGKQSNFHLLTDVVLSNMSVKSAGENNEIRKLAPNIRNLDLSQNLMSSWVTVHKIVQQLDNLTTLVLSKNRLESSYPLKYHGCYKSVKTLVLNNMLYTWREVLELAKMWPEIEELSLQNNRITSLSNASHPVFSQLRILSLDNNAIETTFRVNELGQLPRLKELHLDNVGLTSIEFRDALPMNKSQLFPNLEILFVRNNKLSKWKDINELNKLPKLKSLVISNNPVFASENPETVRQFIIAKILDLEWLNKLEITKSERRGAEFDYIKRFYKEWLLEGNKIEFMLSHPTYNKLLLKHGAPEEGEVNMKSTLIKDNLISVKLVSSLPENPPVIKRLPGEMSIGKLKALVKRIFRIPSTEVRLSLFYNEDESRKTELDNNLRQLSFYSLSDKDKIVVEW